MFSKFHDRFGTAGLVVAVVALVVALAGTAFAAAGLNSKQKKEVTKIAKKYAGKNGAPGTNGTNGTNGKDGAQGPPGPQGAQGPQGPAGPAGPAGAAGPTGAAGVAGTAGPTGPTGPADFDVLPSGETLEGVYSTDLMSGEALSFVDISFVISLSAAPTVNWVKQDGTTMYQGTKSNCDGTVAEPKADPGNLCLYTQLGTGSPSIGNTHQSKYGVIRQVFYEEGVGNRIQGTWAVTAP